MYLSEKKLESEEIYNGIVVHLTKDTVELENGEKSIREVIHHPGGVCVVPLTDDNEVIMVRQFRYPFSEALLEVPAGKLNFGEDHFECGKRELKEETGATAKEFIYLGALYPTVAYDTETIHMYLAKGLDFGDQKLDEGEYLDVVKVPLDELVSMVMENKLHDAKTQLAILKTHLMLKG